MKSRDFMIIFHCCKMSFLPISLFAYYQKEMSIYILREMVGWGDGEKLENPESI